MRLVDGHDVAILQLIDIAGCYVIHDPDPPLQAISQNVSLPSTYDACRLLVLICITLHL